MTSPDALAILDKPEHERVDAVDDLLRERNKAVEDLALFKASLTTPEGYRGVVSDLLADEVERLTAECDMLRHGDAACVDDDGVSFASARTWRSAYVSAVKDRDALRARLAAAEEAQDAAVAALTEIAEDMRRAVWTEGHNYDGHRFYDQLIDALPNFDFSEGVSRG